MAKCPHCGEPVSQFAAGCAICGADLEAQRRKAGARGPLAPLGDQAGRVGSRLTVRGMSDTARQVWIVVLALAVTILLPVIGIIGALVVAFRSDLSSEARMRAALACVALVGLLLLISPQTRVGLLSLV